MGEFRDLSYAECRAVLERGTVGRVGICTPDGPYIIPVNYTVLDEAIVVRTGPFSLLASQARGAVVAFEVDHLDPEGHLGWSVLARGKVEVVDDPRHVERIRRLAEPVPWASGSRNLYLWIVWKTLTGRQVGENEPRLFTP